MSNVVEIQSVEQYNEVVKEDYVVVKVSTSTCAPCKMMGPVFEKISEDAYDGDPTFVSLVADQSAEFSKIARDLKVTSVPSFLVYKNGSIVNQFSGAFPSSKLVEKLNLT